MAKKNRITPPASAQSNPTNLPAHPITAKGEEAALILHGAAAINALIKNPPPALSLSTEEIEEIVRGENLLWHLETIDKGLYLRNMLSGLEWWLDVANQLLDVGREDLTRSGRESEEIEIGAKIKALVSLYPVAFQAKFAVEAVGSDPTGLELVKRFRDLKLYIYELVKHDYPEVDCPGLLALV